MEGGEGRSAPPPPAGKTGTPPAVPVARQATRCPAACHAQEGSAEDTARRAEKHQIMQLTEFI